MNEDDFRDSYEDLIDSHGRASPELRRRIREMLEDAPRRQHGSRAAGAIAALLVMVVVVAMAGSRYPQVARSLVVGVRAQADAHNIPYVPQLLSRDAGPEELRARPLPAVDLEDQRTCRPAPVQQSGADVRTLDPETPVVTEDPASIQISDRSSDPPVARSPIPLAVGRPYGSYSHLLFRLRPLLGPGDSRPGPNNLVGMLGGMLDLRVPRAHVADPSGQPIDFYDDLIVSGDGNPQVYLYTDSTGCVALQVDGPDFSLIRVFRVYATRLEYDQINGRLASSLDQVAGIARRSVGFQPVLVSAAQPGWFAETPRRVYRVMPESQLDLVYVDQSGTRVMRLHTGYSNPPTTVYGETRRVSFRSDSEAVYGVYDRHRDTSRRYVRWLEPGVGTQLGEDSLGRRGIQYMCWADGMTDAEFWDFLSRLKAV